MKWRVGLFAYFFLPSDVRAANLPSYSSAFFFDFWAARGAGRIFSHFELRLRPLGPKEKYPEVIKKSFVRHNEGYRYLGDEERHERMRYKLMENCSLKTKSSAKLRHCTLWLFAAGKCMNSFFRGGDLIGVRTDPTGIYFLSYSLETRASNFAAWLNEA